MKKLGKKIFNNRLTVQAYACYCDCACDCYFDQYDNWNGSGQTAKLQASWRFTNNQM